MKYKYTKIIVVNDVVNNNENLINHSQMFLKFLVFMQETNTQNNESFYEFRLTKQRSLRSVNSNELIFEWGVPDNEQA